MALSTDLMVCRARSAAGALGSAGLSTGDVQVLELTDPHGIAATLIFAQEQKAAAAVFVVFEFPGPSCSDHNLACNAADLDAFVSALAPPAAPLSAAGRAQRAVIAASPRRPGPAPVRS